MDEEIVDPRVGKDPSGSDDERVGGVSIAELADQLFRKRKGRNLTLGQASEQIGVSSATLSRFERLRKRDESEVSTSIGFVPDTRTLTAITRWLDVSLGRVVESVGDDATPTVSRPDETVPDRVEAHLRADRNLDDEAALALSQIFRMAYDQVVRRRRAEGGPDGHDKHEGVP